MYRVPGFTALKRLAFSSPKSAMDAVELFVSGLPGQPAFRTPSSISSKLKEILEFQAENPSAQIEKRFSGLSFERDTDTIKAIASWEWRAVDRNKRYTLWQPIMVERPNEKGKGYSIIRKQFKTEIVFVITHNILIWGD